MAELSFFLSSQYATSAAALAHGQFDQVLLLSDAPASFAAVTIDHPVVQTLGFVDAASQWSLIQAVAASQLSPSKDAGASAEVVIREGERLRKVIVACLPTTFSRHNAPARSHAVANLVKANKGSKDLQVILFPSDASYAYAQACAVSRQFPQFQMKSSSSSSAASAEKKAVEVHVVLHLEGVEDAQQQEILADVTATAPGIRLCQRLVDTPPNLLHSTKYVEEATALAHELGCGIDVIQGEELDRRGFGGIWCVGKASHHLPALIVLSHVPAGKEDSPSICLVGKGIIYDTGGLSIKSNMCTMKTDMGGSSAVLGAFATAVRRNVNVRLHAILCVAENSVGPLATRPDDVITFLSGKTVEINNTDAEGRLVLADGCHHAYKSYGPSTIIDMATLTGAQLITTGKNHAAIFTNNEDLEKTAFQVGRQTGDLTFPILYCPEFHRDMYKSQVADMKNSVSDRMNAQSSCAGQFISNHIEDFVENGGKWLHIDMAGCVAVGERATGYGVALLFNLVKELAK